MHIWLCTLCLPPVNKPAESIWKCITHEKRYTGDVKNASHGFWKKYFDFSKYISLTWKRPCICACILLLTARNQDQLRKQQARLDLLLTSVFTLLGIILMRHMEIIHSSIPLRKRNTRTHRDYESVCGGDSIASDVTVKPEAIDPSYWGLRYRCKSLEKRAKV